MGFVPIFKVFAVKRSNLAPYSFTLSYSTQILCVYYSELTNLWIIMNTFIRHKRQTMN